VRVNRAAEDAVDPRLQRAVRGGGIGHRGPPQFGVG
jgi:hypothetical protein